MLKTEKKPFSQLLLAPNGSRKIAPNDPEEGFTLEELYELIGCERIEAVPVFPNATTLKVEPDFDRILIVDEEGALKANRVYNPIASALNGAGHRIFGNAVYCDTELLK